MGTSAAVYVHTAARYCRWSKVLRRSICVSWCTCTTYCGELCTHNKAGMHQHTILLLLMSSTLTTPSLNRTETTAQPTSTSASASVHLLICAQSVEAVGAHRTKSLATRPKVERSISLERVLEGGWAGSTCLFVGSLSPFSVCV